MKLKQSLPSITGAALVLSVLLTGGVLPVLADHDADQDRDQMRDRDRDYRNREGDRDRDRDYRDRDGEGSRDRVRDITEVVLSEVLFGDRDRRILDDYLRTERYEAPRQKHKKLPPGLRKKLARGGQLPPGWQKKMSRWEVMDDDIYRQSTRLPEHIVRQLSDSPTGTSIRRVEDRIVRIMDATHTILDVLSAGSRDY
jgi:Ni/Co efflux regulator RcnB